jgi:hypothetical protein
VQITFKPIHPTLPKRVTNEYDSINLITNNYNVPESTINPNSELANAQSTI